MIHLTNEIEKVQDYLSEQNLLHEKEIVERIEKPGEGNMNFTLRTVTSQRSFILKQSRDYVEKYPQVAAPGDRILTEAAFYKLIERDQQLKKRVPGIIHLDRENNIMLMQDLGQSNDYTNIYNTGISIEEAELLDIIDFAARMHNNFDEETVTKPIRNMKMRRLNHEHIFIYPFMPDNGLDLDSILPGLAELAKPYQSNTELKSKVEKLGELYLDNGPKLLHGDYFPGSWLKTSQGIRIIDPEFSFFGYPEFELGVVKAHLKMADQNDSVISKAISYYLSSAPLRIDLMNEFFAIEVMRRIMGLAQLPLQINLEARSDLLKEAKEILTT